jgi:hypothetical protein
MLHESGVLNMLKEGKFGIVNRRYIDVKLKDKLSWPNPQDVPVVNNFKSRARLRHETFNGRIRHFNILSEIFRGSEKHGPAFEAVCVLVQYQMENGSPLFAV